MVERLINVAGVESVLHCIKMETLGLLHPFFLVRTHFEILEHTYNNSKNNASDQQRDCYVYDLHIVERLKE